MNYFQYFVLLSICLVIITSTFLAFKFRKNFDHNYGNMIAMIIGTNIGLTVGVLFGDIYQGNLFASTLISMFVGILAGSVCGLPFGLMGCLEGFMAGLMSSMMGAMLGVMITSYQSGTLIKILLTLTISSLFLFFIIPHRSKDELVIKSKIWFLKPIITVLLVASYLFIGTHFSNDKISTHHNQKNTIIIEALGFKYLPNKISIVKNEPISIILKNKDSIEHDIEIWNIPVKIGAGTGQHSHSNNYGILHLHAPSNSQSEITFTPIQQGKYKFFCSIPGHKEKGMVGEIVVN